MWRVERARYRLVAHALVAMIALLVAIPGYLLLDPLWRPFALRLAGGGLVIAGCVRLVGRVRRSVDEDPASALDGPPPPSRVPTLDERFLRLRDDLVFSTRSRHYFDAFLWPRLQKLGAEGTPPAERRWTRQRGPSLASLDRVITTIERRP
jgi:hypothetical protein